MKARNIILPLIFLALNVLWLFAASPVRADWLALDGQNTIWRLADTNGADASQFAYLTPYHEEWFDMALGPNGNVSAVRRGDADGNGIDSFAPDGSGAGSITVGPNINGQLYSPGSLTTGPDGNIYIADSYWDSISRYNGTNGAFMGTFVTNTSANNLTFGPDGNLYVADANLGVVRYNGTNGAYMNTFVPLGTNGVPDAANLVFGPDGNLYVCSDISNAVIRFDGGTGQFMDYFVPPGSGGLSAPNWPVFGPDGNLYVASSGGVILRYDGRTGAFLDSFSSHAVLGLVYLPNTDPPPLLGIQLTATNTVQISWPSAAGDSWTLCCQRSCGATNLWAVVTNTPTLVGTNYVVTEPCASTAAFYRIER